MRILEFCSPTPPLTCKHSFRKCQAPGPSKAMLAARGENHSLSFINYLVCFTVCEQKLSYFGCQPHVPPTCKDSSRDCGAPGTLQNYVCSQVGKAGVEALLFYMCVLLSVTGSFLSLDIPPTPCPPANSFGGSRESGVHICTVSHHACCLRNVSYVCDSKTCTHNVS